ncbi:hypothetical protein C8Q80DRAFT_164071 [Daedaleopsis nitida]|nr:hypothetical protein C8Q80DRAFT_164071 [Daedaleopsis nitida]
MCVSHQPGCPCPSVVFFARLRHIPHMSRPLSLPFLPLMLYLAVRVDDSWSSLRGVSDVQTDKATVYGLTSYIIISIQVLPCPSCKHRLRMILGPDLGSTGILNWNNSHLFTHELLNTYTNQLYAASETPFSAFCLTDRRSYEDHLDASGQLMKFCSDETFVRASIRSNRVQVTSSLLFRTRTA